ncbi:MAG: WD40/YVTN/BNR-like repeat-containing protein [Pseudomarimonas sp.]
MQKWLLAGVCALGFGGSVAAETPIRAPDSLQNDPAVHGSHLSTAQPEEFRDNLSASWNAPKGGSGTWVHVGPAPILHGSVEGITNRPVTGAINAAVPHPTNPAILYVAAVNGGIWRTSNATAASPNWTPLTDTLRSNSVRTLAADPTAANLQTLVAGIGRNSSIGIGGSLIGMLRSTNGGSSWTTLDGGGVLVDRNITAVAARAATLLAATTSGLYRSTDTGASFALLSGNGSSGLPPGTVTDMVGDPNDNAVLYLAAMGTTRGLYQSLNTGATWSKISDASVDATLMNIGRVRLAVGNSAQVFAVVVASGRVNAVFRYTPATSSWTALGVPTTVERDGAVFGVSLSQGGLHLSVSADPTDANIVYVGGDRQPCFDEAFPVNQCFPNSLGALDYSGRLFRGVIGGNPGWTSLTHSGAGNNSSPHADSRGMVFDANGDLIEVNDGGVYKRVAPRTTTGSWVSLNGDLAVTEFHGISHDGLTDRVMGGTQDTGTPRQFDSSRIFISVLTGDGGDTAIDNTSSATTSTRYVSFQWLGSFRRLVYNAASTLQSQAMPALTPLGAAPAMSGQFYTPIAVNAVNGFRLVFLADNGVYESMDQGATISRIATSRGNALMGDPLVYGLPGNVEFLYFAAGNALFLRSVAGEPPTQRSTLGSTSIVDVAADPATPTRLFAMNQTTVFVSTSSASAFSNISGNLAMQDPGTLRSMAFVPRVSGNVLVVGADRGVFVARAPDFNAWTRLGQGLPNAPLFEMEYNAARDALFAGLLGRGIWRLDSPNAPPPLLIFSNGFESDSQIMTKGVSP